MSQHFLLSAQARTMSLRRIFGLSDEVAFELFRNSRWGNGEEATLPLKVYLAVIPLYSNVVKGVSALQLSRDLDVQYKTAFILAHTIRESLMVKGDESALAGEVEMDGVYVNGHVRPANKKADRVYRRLAEHQKPGKRCIFVSGAGDSP